MFLRVLSLADRRFITVLVVLAVASAGWAAAAAQDVPVDTEYLEDRLENDALLNENRQSVAVTDQQLAEASSQLEALNLTAYDVEAAIAALDVEIAAARRQYDLEFEAQSRAIRAAAAVRNEIEQNELELDALQTIARERAVAAYISPVRMPKFIPYLQSGSLTELQRKIALLSVLADDDAALIDELRNRRVQLDDRLAEQEYLEAKADEQREVTAAARVHLDSKRAEQDELRAQLDAEIAAFQAEVDALAAARAELDRIIASREARFRAEAQVRARWREECDLGRTPVDDQGTLVDCVTLDEKPPPSSMIWPAVGIVSSEFGERWGRMHEGIDIAASSGTSILAAEDGVVFFAGWLGGYGNTTIIDHGGGVMTLYGHQSSLWVVDGQQVVRGEGIGAMGSTGNSTGPHLHFETLVNGEPVNPRQFLV